MKIIEIDTEDRRLVKTFLELPFRLYANVPTWVPPLAPDARLMLNRKRHPFYRYGEAAFFLAFDNGPEAIGRLAVLNHHNYNEFNRERTAFFYLFECEQNLEAANGLFESAFAWARSRNLNKITGPKGFTVLDGIGLLVKGFEHRPAFGLPYNLPHYPALLEASGFSSESELVSGYLSTKASFPEKIDQIAQAVKKRRGLHVTNFKSRRELRTILPKLKELYNSSLENAVGVTPLTDEEVKTMADQMLWFADPRLIKIVLKGGKPVGFLLAYPDISAAVQRTRGRIFPFGWIDMLLELRRTKWININGAGMVDNYRGLGGTALLFSEMHKSAMEGNYDHADIVQIGIANDRMQREMRGLGIDFYKVHRLYQRAL